MSHASQITRLMNPIHDSMIRSFQVRFTNGFLEQGTCINCIALEYILEESSLSEIAKISFYFESTKNPFHSLVLRNTSWNSPGVDNKFEVEFFSYYNDYNEMVYLTSEEKKEDYNLVMEKLNTSEILKEKLIPSILVPKF